MRSPQEYLSAITAVYPCPAVSGFERAAWLYECREAIRWILGYVSAEYKREVASVAERGLVSDVYQIVEVEQAFSSVNIDLLRSERPQVFAELVHLRASDAQKILGRRRLYELAVAEIGEDAVRAYEVVNVKDVERVMLPRVSARYIDVGSKVIDYAVVEVSEGEV